MSRSPFLLLEYGALASDLLSHARRIAIWLNGGDPDGVRPGRARRQRARSAVSVASSCDAAGLPQSAGPLKSVPLPSRQAAWTRRRRMSSALRDCRRSSTWASWPRASLTTTGCTSGRCVEKAPRVRSEFDESYLCFNSAGRGLRGCASARPRALLHLLLLAPAPAPDDSSPKVLDLHLLVARSTPCDSSYP